MEVLADAHHKKTITITGRPWDRNGVEVFADGHQTEEKLLSLAFILFSTVLPSALASAPAVFAHWPNGVKLGRAGGRLDVFIFC